MYVLMIYNLLKKFRICKYFSQPNNFAISTAHCLPLSLNSTVVISCRGLLSSFADESSPTCIIIFAVLAICSALDIT